MLKEPLSLSFLNQLAVATTTPHAASKQDLLKR